jgi:20S proteasome alpha/beta subunit
MKNDNFIRFQEPYRNRRPRGKDMTICIASICGKRNIGLAVADRMVTEEDLSVEFEHEEKKIIPISKNCVAMTSGSAISYQEILEPIISRYKNKKPNISEIAEEIAKSYDNIRTKKIEEKYFRPRKLTIKSFYKNHSGLNEQLVRILDKVINDFEFPDLDIPGAGLDILIVGVDSKAHIYLIENPGTTTPFDVFGWDCIGTGYPQAENSLISNKFVPSLDFKKGLFLSYEAKIRAEVSPGVGREWTDIVYIDERGIHFLSDEKIKKLKALLEEKEKLTIPKLKGIDEKLQRLSL